MLAPAAVGGLTLLTPPNDDTIGRALRDHGEFARPEADLLIAYLEALGGDLIDIGANLGAMALPAAKARPGARVVAVEANRAMAQLLSANAVMNGLLNVEVHHAAAGAAPGLVEFPDVRLTSTGNLGAIRMDLAVKRRCATRMLTLDEIATPATRVVKIDVEGYEREVLQGAPRTLREQKPVLLLEANPGRPGNREVAETLLGAGYRLFWFFAPFVTPASARNPGKVSFDGDMNYLALPPGAPELWPMQPVKGPDAGRPYGRANYPYLEAYGYDLG